MKTHKNARLTFARRLEMARSVVEQQVTLSATAARHGVSLPTARKWLQRYRADGSAGLRDHTSRPHRIANATDQEVALEILALRQSGLTMRRIALQAGCSASTVSRICAAFPYFGIKIQGR